jgi:hypothetical protein
MKHFLIISVTAFIVSGCEFFGELAALQAADFYECPPGNTLVVCAPGTVPADAECRSVGSGQTTIAPRACG